MIDHNGLLLQDLGIFYWMEDISFLKNEQFYFHVLRKMVQILMQLRYSTEVAHKRKSRLRAQ